MCLNHRYGSVTPNGVSGSCHKVVLPSYVCWFINPTN